MTGKGNDPLQVWHGLLEEMEKNFNQFAGAAVGSEQFSQTINRFGSASIAAQKSLGEVIERYLMMMNLPSRADLIGLAERMQAMEARLNEIAAILHRAHPEVASETIGFAGMPKPKRTKRPPEADRKSEERQ